MFVCAMLNIEMKKGIIAISVWTRMIIFYEWNQIFLPSTLTTKQRQEEEV